MKKVLIALLMLSHLSPALSQAGFNNKYDLDLSINLFRNLLLDGDTLIVFGVGIQPNTNQQGIVFVKMDTFGNVHQSKIILDESGDSYTAGLNYSIIKSSDSLGYILVGEPKSVYSGFLMKLNKEGDLILYQEQTDSTILVVFQRNVIEVKNGFFLSGHKQKSDFSIDIYVACTDKSGNKLWEKSYGQPGIQDFQGSLVKISDNEFVIGGSHQSPQNTPIPQKWARAWLFAIDSLGEVLWEFEESENLVDAGVVGLNPTPDGGWLYCSGKTEIFSANDWGSRCQIVRRDSNFNLLWTRILSETSYSTNSMVDMKPMPDGTWAAMGRWSTPIISGQSNYLGGSLHRLNESGDTLWSKLFTAFPASPNGSENYLGGVAVLPSGSLVAAGYTRRFAPPTTQYFGWVIKVTADGCIDTLCITSSAPVPVEEEMEVMVYPNPASDMVGFQCQGFPFDNMEVAVFNTSGQVMWRHIWESPNATWYTKDVPPGMYFYQISEDNKTIKTGKIVVQR